MTHFESLIAKKTIEELMEYIDNFERCSSGALTFVVNELKTRGVNFSDEELDLLYKKIEKKKEKEEESNIFSSSKSHKKYIVTDPNAPLLYSKIAVALFSILFNTFFGAILLALNIENKINKIKVIVFGVVFTTLAIWIANLLPHSTFHVYTIYSIGAYVLSTEFWNKYIGRETKYRKKPIWMPLIISIIITGLLAVAMFYE